MPLNNYKNSGLLFNSNFLSETSEAGVFAYRGELVLVEGGIGDAKGHAKPPLEIMRGAVMLGSDKLKMVIGALDQLELLTTLVEKYKTDFASDMKAVLYVVNIKDPIQVVIEGINFVLIPLVQGVPWNEMSEELALEKGDFKGQSPADKLLTVYNELQSYQPKSPTVSLDDALAGVTETVREAWGAV
jgi:hypothetical protein